MNFNLSRISALQIFQLIRFSTLILIGVVFSKAGLATSEIGQYETFLFLAGAVSFFWLNGLIQGFLPIVRGESNSAKNAQFFSIFYLLLIFSFLAAGFVLIFEQSISGLLLNGSDVPFLKYLLIYLLVSSPASLIEYIYLVQNHSRKMVVYGIVSFLLMFLLVTLPEVFGKTIEYSMAGLVASVVVRFVWLLVLLFRYSTPIPDVAFLRKHLKSAAPLVFSMFLSGSAQYVDGFIITSFFDEATFAVFRFGAREFPLVLLLANAFSASMLPGFANQSNLKTNLEQIRQNSEKLGRTAFRKCTGFQ